MSTNCVISSGVRLETLGLVGNCQYSALIDATGSVTWSCLPRFDAEPVFGTLLAPEEGGYFSVGAVDQRPGRQRYLENTNVLETTFETADGAFRVIDFAPRFIQYDRAFRPVQLFRIVEPIWGTPVVRVRCEPRLGWSQRVPARHPGSNHVQFEGFAAPLRLTTDVPTSYLGGQPFALAERRHLALTWGLPIEEPLAPLADRFLTATVHHWRQWIRHCNIPPVWQQEVIRSALALKLHCFEDTGAIAAALTTSIPEAPGTARNWDYRYCWLRDAFYSLAAFRLLGHFEEREQFVKYLLSVAANTVDLNLQPLYRIDGTTDLTEKTVPCWPGFEGHGPVRTGNAASLHHQHDVFGEMVLALAPVFLDDRFGTERTPAVLDLVERLATRAIAVAGTPDAGIWEFRSAWKPQTFSSLMSWAAADRMSVVAERHRPRLATGFASAASRIREEILSHAWSPKLQCFTGSYRGEELDASLLQMATLRFLPSDDDRLRCTIERIRADLSVGGWLLRYRQDDGLGTPQSAFVLCTFWLVEALVTVGRIAEARQLMSLALEALSPLGLLAEDYDPSTQQLWGNFPQAYSHVGLIHAAFAASPRWADVT
jgi:GH15 family glucan-1,4-alpha-glucosidase